MSKIRIIIAVLCAFAMASQAQRISRDYHNLSMSKVLVDLDRASSRYHISFIYNELEDFTVTKQLSDRPVLDAVRDVIGYYPLAMHVGDSIITVECISKAERRLTGRLVDDSGKPVIFANIQLLSVADTAFITGGVSNENGQFVIPCAKSRVMVRVTCVGYKTVESIADVADMGVVKMHAEQYAINGIMVRGSRRVDKVDRSVFTFSDEQKKNSRETQEILTTLPGLRKDEMSGTLKTMTGKSLKILVNGVEATDNDLKTIPVDKIRNVEYYTVPPARYANVGTLINVRTQPLDAGYAVGFDEMQGAWFSFNNTNVYARYNKGNHQFSFDYSLSYRNHADCESEDSYVFSDGSNISNYLYRGNYHFGYSDQRFNMRYAYSKEDDLTFQAKFSPNIFYRFWRNDSEVEAHNNPLWNDGKGRQDEETRSFGPSLDLYFSKNFKNGHELTLDVLGTYYHNSQSNHNRQWIAGETPAAGNELIDDDMRSKNNKYSVIGEVAYTKSWSKTNLSFGYKATLARSDYMIRNILSGYEEYSYTSNNDNHYFYGEVSGGMGKLSYRLGVGGTYVNTSNDENKYSKLYFTPKLVLAYPIKNGQLQLQLKSEPVLPAIAQLSNSVKVVIPGLNERGNPYLQSGNDNAVMLSLNLGNPYLDIYWEAVAEYITDPICTSFIWDEMNGEHCIVSSPLNGKYELVYGTSAYMRLKPFKSEVFTVGINIGAYNDTYKSDIVGRQSHFRVPLDWNISFRKGRFGASWYCNIPSKYIDGPKIFKEENTSNISLFYQHKQLRVGVTSIFFLRTPHYEAETLPNDIIQYRHWNEIPMQRSGICVNLSYNIFSGKQKNVKKKVNNYDGDKGTL